MTQEQTAIYTWSDLMAFWECPRAWSYGRMGFRPLEINDAMLNGSLVHAGIKAHWQRAPIRETMDAAVPEGAEEQAKRLLPQSLDLVQRYIQKYGDSITPDSVDKLYTWRSGPEGQRVGGHPDLVGWSAGKFIVAEHKTTTVPNLVFLDHLQQVDFYALLVANATGATPALVFIDVLSPEYITRIERPPRLEEAAYIFYQLNELMRWQPKEARLQPHYGYRCRTCWFFKPCHALDSGLNDRDVLDEHFLIQPERNIQSP